MLSQAHELLTTRQLADSLGVSESSVKRWVDDGAIQADRTSGGHRRIPMASAVRFMRSRGLAPTKPESLMVPGMLTTGSVDEAAVEMLFQTLIADDADRARGIIFGRYMAGADIATISDRLFQPVLSKVGELWQHSPEGILIEHRTVQTCVHAMTQLAGWLEPLADDAPRAVVGAGPGDPYILPSMLASLTLRECGFKSHNLGAQTPLATMALAVERYAARLCALSVSVVQDGKRMADWSVLQEAADRGGCGIVIGGRRLGALPGEIRGRAVVCESMAELSAYASGLLKGIAGAGSRGEAP